MARPNLAERRLRVKNRFRPNSVLEQLLVLDDAAQSGTGTGGDGSDTLASVQSGYLVDIRWTVPRVRIVILPSSASISRTGSLDALTPSIGSQNHSRPTTRTRSSSGTRSTSRPMTSGGGSVAGRSPGPCRRSPRSPPPRTVGRRRSHRPGLRNARRSASRSRRRRRARLRSGLLDSVGGSSHRNVMFPAAWYTATSVNPDSTNGARSCLLVNRRLPVLIARRNAKYRSAMPRTLPRSASSPDPARSTKTIGGEPTACDEIRRDRPAAKLIGSGRYGAMLSARRSIVGRTIMV